MYLRPHVREGRTVWLAAAAVDEEERRRTVASS